MKKAALASLAALLLLVSACGGTDAPAKTADGKKVVRALTTALTDPDQGVETKDASCIASRFVDALDVQPLVEAKVVTTSLRYVDGAVEASSGKTRTAFETARARCLEDKVARTMVAVISTKNGLISAKHASCIAREFTRHAGYDGLVSGHAVTSRLSYVSNGAIQTPQNATAYAAALEKCVGKKKAVAGVSKAVEAAFATGSGGPALGNVSCLVTDFVKKVGISGLLANKVVSDTGAFNTAGARYDAASARQLATSILGCVDALRSQAETAANADKSLDVDVLEACLKKAISTEFLRDDFLVNQLVGKDAQAQSAAAEIQSRSQACEKAQR